MKLREFKYCLKFPTFHQQWVYVDAYIARLILLGGSLCQSAFAWHGATDQNRYTSDHDTGDWDQYVAPTVEENVRWPFSSARHWSSLDVDDDPLDISRNAHIGSSVGAIPRVVGLDRSIPPIDHEDHRLPELSSDIHRDDTDISTEPDLSLSDADEDDGRDGNDRFEDIGPSSPVQLYLYDVPEFFTTIYDKQCPDSIGVPSVSGTLEDSERTSEDPFDEQSVKLSLQSR
ncbi:hypothetical protein F511_09977 [Dorcoceras hygrometricum]|uniref:Uncharacterized protein n=1 Tax=Dorcoceras hygrometricum TaxID=472368 RepID=A0A2Z7D3H0_9LAMI|nr:hypothetical protein F511_09977 [Dorcoceras hygrometricum]